MKKLDLDIPTLRSFVAVAETGGFTAAGEKLHRTQSAVTMKIQKLEELLGKKVFNRTSRSLTLTNEGEILLNYANRLLSLNDETVGRMINPDINGEIRLGVADYALPNILPHLVKRFRTQYPKIHMIVSTGVTSDLLEQQAQGSLDIVLAGSGNQPDNFSQLLFREPLVWVCAKTFILDLNVAIPLALMPPPCHYRFAILNGLKACQMSFDILFTSSSIAGIQAAVNAGIVITALPYSCVLPEMRLLKRKVGFPPLGEVDLVLYGGESLNKPHIRPLIQFLREEIVNLKSKVM